MNEIYDKLIIRIFFTIFLCAIIAIYKYLHIILYPSAKLQLFKTFKPTNNNSDTIHLFSRIIGIGLLLSEFHFYMSDGIAIAVLDFSIRAFLAVVTYLASLYILESIALYNFEYADEILKRKNYSYALICFTNAIVASYLIKTIIKVSNNSLVIFIFLWLFAIVIIGLTIKAYPMLSKLPFNKLVVQKNMAIALSYMGFIWGWGIIIASSINGDITNIKLYAIYIILKILLSIIVFPLFRFGIIWIFSLKDDFQANSESADVGYGVFEGTIYFTSCFLISIITEQVHFGTFYPIF